MICLYTFQVSGKKPVLHQGTSRDQLCKRHLTSLDNAYYERGQARLKRLAEWSRSHIPKVKNHQLKLVVLKSEE